MALRRRDAVLRIRERVHAALDQFLARPLAARPLADGQYFPF
jgi:hypothetical protein